MRAALIGLLLLGACAAQAPAPEPSRAPQTAEEATAQDACGASRYRPLIGTRLDAIDPAAMPPGARLITPDTMVTQDFRPTRLNVMSGTDGLVSSLACF
jgi:PBP1b-binding outer membrane lipoprotein LpoB